MMTATLSLKIFKPNMANSLTSPKHSDIEKRNVKNSPIHSYLRELRALISFETNVALPFMCSYLLILWFQKFRF